MNKTMTIEWHDLIEDPKDLPPISSKSTSRVWLESDEVFVQTKYGFRFQAMYCRPKFRLNEEGEGVWFDITKMTELNKDDIVAWVYIPKYHNREKQIDDLLMKLPIMVFHRIKEADKTNKYPEPGHNVIIFEYDESENSIVSTAGFYENGCWKAINRYSNSRINDVIGWSPFFKIHETHSDNKEQ